MGLDRPALWCARIDFYGVERREERAHESPAACGAAFVIYAADAHGVDVCVCGVGRVLLFTSTGFAAMAEEDALRTGPVRLLGYANEVGESFRPLVSRAAVLSSYGVAGTYVVADAWWRSRTTGRMGEAVDTLIWQGLASVAIPGYFINRVVWAAGRMSPPHLRATLPTALGLACIPLIVKPIDHGVDGFMNQCVRPLYSSQVRKQM